MRAEYEARIAEQEELVAVAKEAHWLTEKFGAGTYADIPGLCKLASRAEIEEKGPARMSASRRRKTTAWTSRRA